jgi:hypothetical protein
MAVLGGRALARGLRCPAKIHYLPFQWATVYAWVKLLADEADEHDALSGVKTARDLVTKVSLNTVTQVLLMTSN